MTDNYRITTTSYNNLIISDGSSDRIRVGNASPLDLCWYITDGGRDLNIIKEIVEMDPNMPDWAYNAALLSAASAGDLDIVKYISKLPGVNVAYQNSQAIINAYSIFRLDIVDYLFTLSGADITMQNHRALMDAIDNNNLDLVKFIATMSYIDITIDNQSAIRYAAWHSSVDIFNFILTLPNVDPSTSGNIIIHNLTFPSSIDNKIPNYALHRVVKCAILLYYEPSIKQTIHPDDYRSYHKFICKYISSHVHKMATIFIELPVPLIIEIIEQSMDGCIYVPYHIKWNMIVKIKHWKPWLDID